VRADDRSFYLAVKRSELNKPYLASIFLKELFPLFTPASHVLGTKLVAFVEQNGRLLVLDVDARKRSSAEFDPEVVLDSYRIVNADYPEHGRAGDAAYLLVDPSSGLNRFGILESAMSVAPIDGGKFATDVVYAERFRALPTGFQLDQVFGGHYEQPFAGNDGSVEADRFALHGTVTLAFTRHRDEPGFTAAPQAPYFFASEARVVENSGSLVRSSLRWHLDPGKPIRWTISARLAALQADERFRQYDLLGAFKRGIENWNLVFGAPVLEAVIANETQQAGDADLNYLVVDEDPEFSVAFSDWVANPDSGQIQRTNIYINAGWIAYAQRLFDPGALDPTENTELDAQIARTQVLLPGALHGSALEGASVLHRMASGLEHTSAEDTSMSQTQTRSGPQLVESYLTHVVLHEVGHTLGLRHNFAGSLRPGSSVMDYANDYDTVNLTEPGPYDHAALRLLYGATSAPPDFPFCTDQDTSADPRCAPFDWGDDPPHGIGAVQDAQVIAIRRLRGGLGPAGGKGEGVVE
jgi:hypothetical protein